ncbi:MAG: hypothetical protein WDM86_11010 [Rhizomicrobium sp.]
MANAVDGGGVLLLRRTVREPVEPALDGRWLHHVKVAEAKAFGRLDGARSTLARECGAAARDQSTQPPIGP